MIGTTCMSEVVVSMLQLRTRTQERSFACPGKCFRNKACLEVHKGHERNVFTSANSPGTTSVGENLNYKSNLLVILWSFHDAAAAAAAEAAGAIVVH